MCIRINVSVCIYVCVSVGVCLFLPRPIIKFNKFISFPSDTVSYGLFLWGNKTYLLTCQSFLHNYSLFT